MRTIQSILCSSIACVVLVTGCATLPWSKTKTAVQQANDEHPVERILCIWQTADGRGLDNLPTRGFAGQIFFFTRNGPTPVVGNGDVDVFLFDDQGTIEEQAKPLHKFEFNEAAWNHLAQNSQVGPAYNVFIPYVRKGQHEAQCALIVRIRPHNGSSTSSDMAYVTLRGTKHTLPTSDGTSQPGELTPAASNNLLGSRTETERTKIETVAQLDGRHKIRAGSTASIRNRPFNASRNLATSIRSRSDSHTDRSAPRPLVQPPVDVSPIPPSRHFRLEPAHSPNGNDVTTNLDHNGVRRRVQSVRDDAASGMTSAFAPPSANALFIKNPVAMANRPRQLPSK